MRRAWLEKRTMLSALELVLRVKKNWVELVDFGFMARVLVMANVVS